MTDEPNDRIPEDADVAERLRRIREELSAMELPDLPDEEVDAHTERLTNRVSMAGDAKFPEPPELNLPPSHYARKAEKRRIQKEGESLRGLGAGMQIAYIIIGVPAIGLGAGWLLEKQFGVPNAIAIGTVLGAALGVFLAARLSSHFSG